MAGKSDHGATDVDFEEIDIATYVAAKTFGAVALPLRVSFAQAASVEANMAQSLDGAENFIIGASGNGPNDGLTPEQRQRLKDDQAWEYLATVAEESERRERRERKEWSRTQSTVGGITMTGEGWDDAFELLSDPKMREQLIQNMTRKKGWPQGRAERAADDALTLAQIAQRKKDGTITPADETKAGEITRNNPDAVEMVKEAARLKADRGYGVDADASASTGTLLSGEMATVAKEYQTALKASSVNMKPDDDRPFASAPDLVARFDAARKDALIIATAEPAKPMSPKLVAQLDMNGPF